MNCLRGIELRIIVFIFLLIPQCSSIFCSRENRETNSTGTACTELEHCVSKFDPRTGQCLAPSNHCAPGWMGPGCQYVNLAYESKVTSDLVFDGNMATHRKIADGRATIHFDGMFYVSALRIRTINGYSGKLIVSDNQSRVLYNDNFPLSSPTIFFTNSSLTNWLHMNFNSSLDIAEIEVFGGKNVALWKSTSQSTTYSDGKISFTSDKAVDGNGDGNWSSHTCTHTKPNFNNPTWKVDLGNAYYITAIKIKNRNDNQNRINGFKLYGTAENEVKHLIYSDDHPSQNRGEIFINFTRMPDVPIKVITVEGLNTGEKILTLCEVFVYASIKNKNGNFCPEKCQTNLECKTDNLVCHTCQHGWEGPYCYRITCQRPTVTPPLQIATDQNKQTFDYNESIQFRCAKGYILNGTAFQHCTQNEVFQQNLPTCSRITCQRPTVTPPLQIATDQNKQTFDYNESIQFRCAKGYILNGTVFQHCTQNEVFQQNLPTCSRIKCKRPTVTPPLHIATNPNKQSFNYSESIEFRCEEEYNLNGSTVQQCTQKGFLQQNLPLCLRITCQRPTVRFPLQIATDLNKQTFDYNESIEFRCPEGYNLNGTEVQHCTQNGILQENLPKCSHIRCQQPAVRFPLQIATDPNKQSFDYNESIEFRCADGYNLTGAKIKHCTQNGIFQQNLPTCSPITCQRPTVKFPLQIATDPNKQTFNYSEPIEFRCEEGHNLYGTAVQQCTQNEIFQQNLPTCSPITCQRPNVTSPLQIATDPIKQTFRFKEKIEFRCAEGYNLNGEAVKHCTQNWIFQQNLSTCSEIKCRRPNISHPLQIDKRTLNDVYHYNHSITFICITGYSLMGKSIKHCKHNEDFQHDLPICKEEVQTISDAAIAGLSVGSLALIVVVVVVIILLRKRNAKKPESKYYKNESLSLDDIDKQYAEVNTNRIRKNKEREPSKLEQASNEQTTTYYNMNSPDVDKAKQARQEVYYEFSPVCRPSKTAVSVSEFKNYVESKKGNQEFFSEQFKKFYTGLQFPATAAVAPGNKSKNKYKNIYPYDETRVLLKIEKGSSDSDFINASFIHGFGNVKSYVAAQGPLINTIDDFWWMVWNEKCDKIVMLTNLVEEDKVKCIQYWPDSDAMDTRNMKLELVVSESFADFTIRTFNLINGKESRTIRQFHFTAWPDKGVPAYASSLVHFHSKVLHTPGTLKGPMVVHCSAGIGRTGTFIALNYLVQQAKESGYVDVFECVETLRRQRLNMVQTLEQYKFLHNATLEALMCTSSDPSASKFPQIYEDLFKVDSETKKRNIDLNFENLNVALSTLPESAYSMAKISTNRKKNRYSNILPVDSEMPEIRDEENNPIYINAVFLPAYKSKRSFIATQMPLKDTAVDFWRLLYEQQVSTIVMLNQLGSDKPKENIGKYWPKDLNAVSEFGPFRITKKGLTEGKDFTIVDLCCHKEGQNKDERKLRLFQCHFWPDSSTVPTSVLAFLKLINDMELHHDRNNSGPLVVHCMNGAEKSGLFCVMQVVLERMKIEQDVAIHHVIQQMRSIRPSIIPNVEQFKFCHDVVLEFLKQFDDYSNFQ